MTAAWIAEPSIYVETGSRALRVAGDGRNVARRIVCILQRTVIRGGHGERAEIRSGNIVGDKTRGAEAVVENFPLNLTAMRVPSQRQLDAELRGAVKRVRIVREQDVRHVSTNEGSVIGKHLKAMAAGG